MLQLILQSRHYPIIERTLFWVHTAIMIFGAFMGFVFAWYITAVLVLLHRLHVIFFGGCIVSRWQIRIGSFKEGTTFVQHFAERLFGRKVSYVESHLTEMAIGIFAITSSIAISL